MPFACKLMLVPQKKKMRRKLEFGVRVVYITYKKFRFRGQSLSSTFCIKKHVTEFVHTITFACDTF